MDKMFCINGEDRYSWTELLTYVNNAHFYYQTYQYNSIVDFFENLVLALAYNQPIILVDADVTTSEIEQQQLENINKKTLLKSTGWTNIEQLIKAIEASNSDITIFTSGTTGQPKKVTHTPSSFMRSVRHSKNAERAVWGFAYNPTHMAGIQVFFQAFCNQSTMINLFGKSRAEIYRLIETYNVTHISATPTFYRLLLPPQGIYKMVERITFGGEKSSTELHNAIQSIFPNAKINNIYASTEAGTLFVAKGSDFQIPLKIRDLIIIQEDGELLLHKSLLGQSKTFNFINDFYHTGDIIEWSDKSNGLFRFVSRKNELINVGGYKINPNEVEEIIRQHISEVKDCIVFAKANSVLGNILCCEIELQPENRITETEIKHILSQYLQNFKIPRIIKFIECIQLTKTGKKQRK